MSESYSRVDFQKELERRTLEAEKTVKKFLPEDKDNKFIVTEGIRYSVEAGGKRLRPVMMKAAFDLFKGEGSIIEPFMAAIEMIHTYSLVHDDLPAMDNDRFRRGNESTWYKYGEAMGILCGDELLNLAAETASSAFDLCGDDLKMHKRTAKALQILFSKSGLWGMLGGQCLDVNAEKEKIKLSLQDIMLIHKLKTAALIEASMCVGAILAGADEDAVKDMEKCAYDIGIAFQIRDDILDVTGKTEELGKPVGSDAENGKETYVTIKGIEESDRAVKDYSDEAMAILGKYLPGSEFLTRLVSHMSERNK
ncbi:MAG: polyprenyl synthetase family protein [Lachnospiraceae bacterium]|nr:polyprenyl synthetase family protein [Lachnospiraceae bacterium]